MRANAPRVAVVGAGAVGLACALALAERGARVRVFDSAARIMAPSDRSASARAAGLLGPFSETLVEPPEKGHPKSLELGLESLALWPDLARQLAPFSRQPVMDRRGALLVSQGGALTGELMRLLNRAKTLGAPARLVSRRELNDLAPSLQARIDLAVMLETEGQVRPGSAMVALLRAVRAATGAQVQVAEARDLLTENGRCVGVRVRPRRAGDPEEERADAVVLAPGAWAPPSLTDQIPALARVSPMKGHLIEVATPAGAVPLPIRAERVYLLPRSERLLRVGATMEPGKRDQTVDPISVRAVREALTALAPGLADAPILSQWAGVRAMSPDWAPLIGPAGPPGCFVACGHSRNGWLLAPITARIIAHYVFEEAIAPLWAAFAADRFEGPDAAGV